MNRLETIKERLNNYNYVTDAAIEIDSDEMINAMGAVQDNAPEDIEYLLQRLERYENALNRLYLACPPPATSMFNEESERGEYFESISEAMEILTEHRHGNEIT